MSLKTLEFTNPTFRDGFNVTVRRGTKWLGIRQALISLGSHYTCVSHLETRAVAFKELTDLDLVFEHDPECRTVAGLAKVMKEVYPEFDPEVDIVTLAVFYIGSRKPEVGDKCLGYDMTPAFMGRIKNIIELNDGFYEIEYMGVNNRTEDEVWDRHIVHKSQYNDTYDGWFVE